MSLVPPASLLELDQEDLAARLGADAFFVAGTPILLQRRGITESDVTVALQTMQPGGGKVGTVVIVTMPELRPEAKDAPGPSYFVRYGLQVIDWPVIRRQSPGGSGVSAEEICDRIRQIIHRVSFGRGQTLFFAGLKPIPVDPGKVSYMVYFDCRSVDAPPPSCATPGIAPASGAGPLSVTLTCQTIGADIWYTTDGSYPAPNGATSTKYTAPFTALAAAVVRAAASLTNYQQGNVAQVQYT